MTKDYVEGPNNTGSKAVLAVDPDSMEPFMITISITRCHL